MKLQKNRLKALSLERTKAMANIIFESSRGHECIPIDDVFLRDRKVFFVDTVTAESCNLLIKKLLYLEAVDNTKPIILFINSPGGEVREGLSVYDTIRLLKSPVYAVVTGIAASMGSIILLACDEDKRLMLKSSTVMVHDCAWGSRDLGGKKPHEVQTELDQLKQVNERIVSIIAERTGKTADEISEITRKDSFFSAEEAIDFGLASAIVDENNFNMIISKGGI